MGGDSKPVDGFCPRSGVSEARGACRSLFPRAARGLVPSGPISWHRFRAVFVNRSRSRARLRRFWVGRSRWRRALRVGFGALEARLPGSLVEDSEQHRSIKDLVLPFCVLANSELRVTEQPRETQAQFSEGE